MTWTRALDGLPEGWTGSVHIDDPAGEPALTVTDPAGATYTLPGALLGALSKVPVKQTVGEARFQARQAAHAPHNHSGLVLAPDPLDPGVLRFMARGADPERPGNPTLQFYDDDRWVVSLGDPSESALLGSAAWDDPRGIAALVELVVEPGQASAMHALLDEAHSRLLAAEAQRYDLVRAASPRLGDPGLPVTTAGEALAALSRAGLTQAVYTGSLVVEDRQPGHTGPPTLAVALFPDVALRSDAQRWQSQARAALTGAGWTVVNAADPETAVGPESGTGWLPRPHVGYRVRRAGRYAATEHAVWVTRCPADLWDLLHPVLADRALFLTLDDAAVAPRH